MNAFALLLLAWPFYLAVNGRLAAYAKLATTGTASTAASAVAQGSAAETQALESESAYGSGLPLAAPVD
jgi:hypothetical protein